ncbi:hypothetical protein [Streptomyces sp. NPDC002779]|uniref:hypothetical protein n=1 Tax=Streptomyces sp. NPDC002779 TaxID=3364664 RepID=UPI003695D40C
MGRRVPQLPVPGAWSGGSRMVVAEWRRVAWTRRTADRSDVRRQVVVAGGGFGA